MKRIFSTIVVLMALAGICLAQQPTVPQPKQQQPSAEDQLAVVRLRAQILDAQTRTEKSQQVFQQAQKDLEALKPELTKLIETIKAKAPAPTKGKVWEVGDDGRWGILLVEQDVPQLAPVDAKTESKVSTTKPKE